MSRASSPLLVGVGSSYGNDRLGWLVVEEIEHRGVAQARVRCARSPIDLLHWLEGVERLVICDACRGTVQVGTCWRFDWPAQEITEVAFTGTHDLNLPATLQLASQMGLLPKHTTVWGLAVECDSRVQVAVSGNPGSGTLDGDLSPEVRLALPAFIEQIERDLQHA